MVLIESAFENDGHESINGSLQRLFVSLRIFYLRQFYFCDLAKRKLRYAGHILRGSGGGLLQLVLEGKVEGIKGRCRPR